jgi:hypothetical protein
MADQQATNAYQDMGSTNAVAVEPPPAKSDDAAAADDAAEAITWLTSLPKAVKTRPLEVIKAAAAMCQMPRQSAQADAEACQLLHDIMMYDHAKVVREDHVVLMANLFGPIASWMHQGREFLWKNRVNRDQPIAPFCWFRYHINRAEAEADLCKPGLGQSAFLVRVSRKAPPERSHFTVSYFDEQKLHHTPINYHAGTKTYQFKDNNDPLVAYSSVPHTILSNGDFFHTACFDGNAVIRFRSNHDVDGKEAIVVPLSLLRKRRESEMTSAWFNPQPPQGEGADAGGNPFRSWMWGVPKVQTTLRHAAIVR